MSSLSPQEKITIYKNLFKGRDDVFAVHWEKADKSASGYTPFCLNEWKSGICIKLKKGKCKDCPNQKYAQLNDYYFKQHLMGYKTLGIYPLLNDNTSYFLAADFDGENWKNDAVAFIRCCNSYDFPAYIEISRSGNGGHVWLFFEDRYLAFKSRNIAFNILREIKIIDQFDKEDSFDRLFPNQDHLSGKGLGNLIALPLQGQSRKLNNTIFLDPANDFAPYSDQWQFLLKIRKIPIEILDQVYQKVNQETVVVSNKTKRDLTITIKEQIYLNKNNLPKIVINFLKENLNFYNSEYIVKKKIGLSVFGLEKYFKLIQTNGDNIAIPRGFLNELINFLNQHDINYKLVDKRNKLESVSFKSELKLYNYQDEALESLLKSENGILVAPPGSGKTIIGIELISKIKQPALILVHRKQIFNQWIERIESFLKIPKREIGQFVSNKKKVGDRITVGMVQTLNRMDDIKNLSENFGIIIVDECHHIPAKMFRNLITKFNPYYLYGLTATPERKFNDAKLIFIYIGDVLHTICKDYNQPSVAKEISSDSSQIIAQIIIKETNLNIPFNFKTDDFQLLSKMIVFDSHRNLQIVNDVIEKADDGVKCLILTERREHVKVLSYYLKQKYEIITLTGELSENQRKVKIKQIKSGHFQILIATGQLIGEGTDFPNLDCLFLAYPIAFSGKLKQYIGRIERGNLTNKIIFDYRDKKIVFLENMFKKRLRYYKKNFGIGAIYGQ
jgi:superfamily II DNA or RNA helicase